MASLLIFFSGCTTKDQEESQQEPVKPVPVLEIQKSAFAPEVEISGTLEPVFSSGISAEAGGTVSQVFVREGDSVHAGELLLSISPQRNTISTDTSAAFIALQNAESSLELAQKQAEQSEKSALLNIEQAEANLKSALNTDASTGVSVEAQIAAAESARDVAQVGLETAQKMLEDTLQNLDTEEKTLEENERNAIASAFSVFRTGMRNADTVLGVTDENRKNNDDFEVYLGFRDLQSKRDAEIAFRTVWTDFLEKEALFSQDKNALTPNDVRGLGDSIRDVLQKTDIMLKQSITGTGFSSTQLTTFQTTTSADRSATEVAIQSLTTASQNLRNFTVQRPQRVRSAELSLRQAESQLSQAEKNLEQARGAGGVSSTSSEAQVTSAKNALESAKIQLEITRKQNEISIQQATSNRDVARSSLERNQVQQDKLTITAPIDGVVSERNVEPGDTISAGQSLFVISQITSLTLKGEIDAALLPSVFSGTKATLSLDGFGKRDGIVSNINPVANSTTRRIGIEIDVENLDELLPANIFATAKIRLPEENGVLLIPEKSLISQNPPEVFVLTGDEDPILETRRIEIGRKQDAEIEVLSGLSSGDRIVSQIVLGLRAGERVEAAPDTSDFSGESVLPPENEVLPAGEEKATSGDFEIIDENVPSQENESEIVPTEGEESVSS